MEPEIMLYVEFIGLSNVIYIELFKLGPKDFVVKLNSRTQFRDSSLIECLNFFDVIKDEQFNAYRSSLKTLNNS